MFNVIVVMAVVSIVIPLFILSNRFVTKTWTGAVFLSSPAILAAPVMVSSVAFFPHGIVPSVMGIGGPILIVVGVIYLRRKVDRVDKFVMEFDILAAALRDIYKVVLLSAMRVEDTTEVIAKTWIDDEIKRYDTIEAAREMIDFYSRHSRPRLQLIRAVYIWRRWRGASHYIGIPRGMESKLWKEFIDYRLNMEA
jgi:hypothetical protein